MLNFFFVQTFISVADCKSFSKASEKLYISKVSVMNQINSLEKIIGVRLFKRTNHGVILTHAGNSFYQSAKKIMRLTESAIYDAQKIGGKIKQTIHIGSSMMRPCNKFITSLENFKNLGEYNFNIVLFNDDIDSLNVMLKSLENKIDCFVSPCGSTKILMNYGFFPLTPCKCVIAMSRQHFLAKKEILRMEDFDNQTIMLVKRGNSYVVDEMRDDFIKNHPSVKIVDFDGYYDISAFNLCENQGYLMEIPDIWAEVHPSLKTVSVDWKYEMPYGVIYSKKPSEKIKKFISDISLLFSPNSDSG